MARAGILIVRLPCRKVFPTGPVYLMSLLHRASPEIPLGLLDLAIISKGRRRAALRDAIHEQQPDIVAFSWRDMQIFSPQDMDGGLRDAFVFFHDPSPARKAAAAFRGLADMLSYNSSIAENLGLIRDAARANPALKIAVGGPSVKIFGDWIQRRLPQRVQVFSDSRLDGFFTLAGLKLPPDPIEPGIDLPAVEHAFPQWQSYKEETIGVQTKQGCPHDCLYCLYGFLEGKRVIRRNPESVVAEIGAYARRWGCRRFWFADAQLLSEPADHGHLGAILEGILREKLALQWGGYLRIHEIDPPLARLMVGSGLQDLEVSLNSGSQEVIDQLHLGFTVDAVMKGFRVLRESGYQGKVLVNLSLNAPGETRETLRETLRVLGQIKAIFGPERVVPVIFFLAIQPHTGLEKRALREGSLRKGYNPLSVLPGNVLRLIYNPPPLGGMIGRCCALAFRAGGGAQMALQLIAGEVRLTARTAVRDEGAQEA